MAHKLGCHKCDISFALRIIEDISDTRARLNAKLPLAVDAIAGE